MSRLTAFWKPLLAGLLIGAVLARTPLAQAVIIWRAYPGSNCTVNPGSTAFVTNGAVYSGYDTSPEAFCPAPDDSERPRTAIRQMRVFLVDSHPSQGVYLSTVLIDPYSYSSFTVGTAVTSGPYVGPAVGWAPIFSEWSNPAYASWEGGVRVFLPQGNAFIGQYVVHYL